MQETAVERAELEALLLESMTNAGAFVRSSFRWPKHALTLDRLLDVFNGMRTVALATSTSAGAPRVAPIGCALIGGQFYIPTTRTAARYRMVARQPAVSLTYFEGTTLAVIVHGHARALYPDEPDFERVDAAILAIGGSSPTTWGEAGDGCYLAVKPHAVLTYVLDPEQA